MAEAQPEAKLSLILSPLSLFLAGRCKGCIFFLEKILLQTGKSQLQSCPPHSQIYFL